MLALDEQDGWMGRVQNTYAKYQCFQLGEIWWKTSGSLFQGTDDLWWSLFSNSVAPCWGPCGQIIRVPGLDSVPGKQQIFL